MATHSSILAWRIPWTEAAVYRVAENQTQLSELKKNLSESRDRVRIGTPWGQWGGCCHNHDVETEPEQSGGAESRRGVGKI